MSIIARDNQKEWTPAPEGLHQAVCVDVIDLGEVDTAWGKKPKVRVVWQIEEISPDDNKRCRVQKQYTISLSEKANLRKDLECWRGRKFTSEELKGFDLEKLVGVNCQLQIIHNLSDEGKTYANIQAIIAAAKGIPKIAAVDYQRIKDRPIEKGTAGKDFQITDDDIPF